MGELRTTPHAKIQKNMKIIATLLFILFGLSAFGQPNAPYDTPASHREPARARLSIGDKSGSERSYHRPVEWQPTDEGYAAECSIPFAWANRQVLLRIASAPSGYALRINGEPAGHVTTGALAAEFNLTRLLKNDTLNRLELLPLDGAAPIEDMYHPEAMGRSELISQPTIRIRDVMTTTRRTGEGWLAEVAIIVKSDALNEKTARIDYTLTDTAGRCTASGFGQMRLRMRGEDTLRFTTPLPDSLLWSPEAPTRYRLRLSTQSLGRYLEYLDLEVGFRRVELSGSALTINGRPFEAEPYEVRNPLTRSDLEQIQARGYNLMVLFPGVPAEELLDLCDELGLCAIAATPYCTRSSSDSRLKGGNPSNDPAWRSEALDRAEACYRLTHRHPSVVGFFTARHSANGICLYESFLHLKSLGDERPILYPEAAGEWNSDF